MFLMPTKSAPGSTYQLKITLLEIQLPIWRRIQVPSTLLLCCLHDAIQATMGWTDSHLHQFEKDGKYWGVPELYEEDDIEVIDESKVPVRKVLTAERDPLIYVYDFGDDWRHEVVLEKVTPSTDAPTKPFCIGGQRRCPPEDVGGVHGYQEFLEVIFQPGHEEFEHYRAWTGNAVHAEEFDIKAVNDILGRMRWPKRHRW
jgi:Plasmid pRiA4b ORF-3-like protein